MHPAIVMAILFYLFSTGAYLVYLFIQRDITQRVGCMFLGAGFACQSIAIIQELLITGHMPVSNLHQTLAIVSWALAGAFLMLYFRFKLKVLGVYTAPIAAFILIAATRFSSQPQTLQTVNVLKGFWLIVHIVTIFLGDAAFVLAAGAGLLYLLQERSIKNKTRGFFFKRLPSLDLLDTTGYACIVSGFTMLTIGLITGMIAAKNVWGHFWSWDAKEVWSAITWIFYAVLLHERLTMGWRGRRAAVMALIGLAVLLFTFLGVNLLLTGHHGQFTQF
ncbi:MAG: c-type cytochrome biogenesis protein CcsB [Desulfobacteraceae bacterium]|nr:c-type cytochrome biogenesis protein CcsB [Desulfobacteraceae bacterium]